MWQARASGLAKGAGRATAPTRELLEIQLQHDLSALGPDNFESLVQSLLKVVIGAGTITFGPGKDGAREATFSGTAPYPSTLEAWSGDWVFQAKFHDLTLLGASKARSMVLKELEDELKRLTRKYMTACDNYILVTNVPLTGVHEVGNRDKIAREVAPAFPTVSNIHIWDANDVLALLRAHRDIAAAYAHLLTPGELIAELLHGVRANETERATTMRMYLTEDYNRDRYAVLEQAGEVSDDKVLLERVFIDLNYSCPDTSELETTALSEEARTFFKFELRRAASEERSTLSLLNLLTSQCVPRCIILGGPGEGKSTIGQYLAQLHRSLILQKEDQEDSSNLRPEFARIPFRVVLRDFAQTIVDDRSLSAIEHSMLDVFLSAQVSRLSGRQFSTQDLHALLATNPCLLILDGLDEVTDQKTRGRVLERVSSFLARAEVLQANLQVVGTSRPNSYANDFEASEYLHLRLARLEQAQVRKYVERWIAAKAFESPKASRLRSEIDACLKDPQLSLLTATPLQITILILIIVGGGTPPRQKEALFADYLEIIYKREKAKSKNMLVSEKPVLFGLHALLGYLIHREAAGVGSVSSTFSQERFESVVAAYLRRCDPFSPAEEIEVQCRQIAVDAGDRFVLIIEPSPGAKGFELRSIQEFFAAAHLNDTAEGTIQRLDRLAYLASSPHWRNVCLFFAGRIGRTNQGEAPGVIEVCREVDRGVASNRFLHRGKWFALELAAERALGPNRSLQDSLLSYGLSVVESRYHHDNARLRFLISRLPIEDVRDHVIPHVLGRVDVLRPSVTLRYLAAFIGRVPNAVVVSAIARNALLATELPEACEFLARHGSSMTVDDAAQVWSRVWTEDEPKGTELIHNWVRQSWGWTLRVLDAANAPAAATHKTMPWMSSTRSGAQSIQLQSSNPRHVLFALACAVEPEYSDRHTRSGVLSRLLSRADGNDDGWTDVAAWIDNGDVEGFAAHLGHFADESARGHFWNAHLAFGLVTPSSVERLASESRPVWASLAAADDGRSYLESGPSRVAVLTNILLLNRDVELQLDVMVRWLAADTEDWLTAVAAFDLALSRIDELDLPTLRSFGMDSIDSDTASAVERAANRIFELSADCIVEAYVRSPRLWSEEGSSADSGTIQLISRAIPSWLDHDDLAANRLRFARLGLLANRGSLGSEIEVWTLLDALAHPNDSQFGRQAILSVLAGSVFNDGPQPSHDRCARWLATLSQRELSDPISQRPAVPAGGIKFLMEVITSAVEQSNLDAFRGGAWLLHHLLLTARHSILEEAMDSDVSASLFAAVTDRAKDLGSEAVHLTAVREWLSIFRISEETALVAGLQAVHSSCQVPIWQTYLQYWQAQDEPIFPVDLTGALSMVLENSTGEHFRLAGSMFALQLAELAANEVPDLDRREPDLGLPFPREDSGY